MKERYTRSEHFLVVLDSRNGTQYNGSMNTDVEFEFKYPIERCKNGLELICSVLSFTCPNSIFNINSTNNLFEFGQRSIPLGAYALTDLYIPYGNYNYNTLSTYLNQQTGFTFSLNQTNNTFTITSSLQFTIGSKSNCGDVMGFLNYTSYYSSATSPYTLVLPYSCNFNGLQNLNIIFDNLNTSNIDSYTSSTSSIIQSVPIISGCSQIVFQRTNDFKFIVKQDEIGEINIMLKDDLRNFIDLNNCHWNLTLEFINVKDIDRLAHDNTFDKILTFGSSGNKPSKDDDSDSSSDNED